MKSKIYHAAAFTLVEIMIVVAIIGLLAAIAIPNFLRARSTAEQNACINNLRQIDGAIQQWALETGQTASATVSAAEIQPYLGRGTAGQLPYCPLDSTHSFSRSYSLTTAANPPTCNLGGKGTTPYEDGYEHVLPK